MFYILENLNLPSLSQFFGEINADMANQDLWIVIVAACLMLALHAIAVLVIAATYHGTDRLMTKKRIYGASFVSYFIAILLVIAMHLSEIVIWAYICVALKVFPTNPQTFYFAGEMYTTVGFGNWTLTQNWKILPIIISFSGIFAVSMSGAALYTMMNSLLGHNKVVVPDDGSKL
ncbi:ion channel [Polynucleobacter asymbioticus]|uniref:Transporter n=1 Tax=Polynucleobacter asymbioticus TaxID=576611 RepID=A0AAC9IS40_9BURK|nr:ion channel [Polynucleobacter asymbioticus]APB98838.1 transporter [Polynucleobacter asymbioticus]APC01141.1 transporter [Polynucleobacter asymbioticus]